MIKAFNVYYKWSKKIHDTQRAQMAQKQDEHNIYVIMKTMCSLVYYDNGFVATHALWHHVPKWVIKISI